MPRPDNRKARDNRQPVTSRDRLILDRSALPVLVPAKLTPEQIRDGRYSGTANFLRRFEPVEAITQTPSDLIAKLHLWQSHETTDTYLGNKALDKLFASDKRIAEAYKHGPPERIAPAILPEEFSRAMKSARLVLWFYWRAKRLRPAVYCPTLKCARYVMAALGDLRCCPCCDKAFIPDRLDQKYCTTKCSGRFRKQKQRGGQK
jgi:hypothetical protein